MATGYSPVEPGGGPRAALALPGVQPDVVVVAARRDERRLRAVPLRQLETKDTAVERQRTFQVGDLQVDVADPGAGVDRARRQAVRASTCDASSVFGERREVERQLLAQPQCVRGMVGEVVAGAGMDQHVERGRG